MVQIDHLCHGIERTPKAQAVKNVARRLGSDIREAATRVCPTVRA
jgi:hypothetical protein